MLPLPAGSTGGGVSASFTQRFIGWSGDDRTSILTSAVRTADSEVVAHLALPRLLERGPEAGAVP